MSYGPPPNYGPPLTDAELAARFRTDPPPRNPYPKWIECCGHHFDGDWDALEVGDTFTCPGCGQQRDILAGVIPGSKVMSRPVTPYRMKGDDERHHHEAADLRSKARAELPE